MSSKKMNLTLDEYILWAEAQSLQPFINKEITENIIIPEFLLSDSTQELITRIMSTLYGDYVLRTKYVLNPTTISSTITYWYGSNFYKYEGLFESTKLQYNPIENYRMNEMSTDIQKNTTNTIDNLDKRQITDNEGQRNDINEYGAYEDTITMGASSNEQQKAVSPFDSNTFTNTEQVIDQIGGRSDTNQHGTHKDSYQKGSVESISTEDARTNTQDISTKGLHTYTHLRSGNIGVTTTQQMIESERKVVDFSIINVISKDIMKILCLRIKKTKFVIIDK